MIKSTRLQRLRIGVLLSLCVVFAGNQTVMAISQEQRNLISSGIYYFDISSSTQSCSGSSVTNLNGKDNLEKAFHYFVDRGLTPQAAAGIAGNLKLESGVDPLISQAAQKRLTADEMTKQGLLGSGGWGIAQWTPPSKIINDPGLKKANKNVNDLLVQLDFLWDNLGREHAVNYKDIMAAADGGNPDLSAADGLKKAQTPKAAADIFFAAFERPQDTSSLAGREKAAEDAYKELGGAAGTAAPSTSSAATDSSNSCGSSVSAGPTTGANLLTLPKGATGRNVYYVNQFSDLDKYRNQVNPNYDFHTCGCGPTSALMIKLSFDGKGDYNAQSLDALLSGLKQTPGAFDGSDYCATSNPGIANYFKNTLKYDVAAVHAKDVLISDADITQMQSYLSKGYLLMADVRGSYSFTSSQASSGHHTVIYGYDANGFYVANPGWNGDTYNDQKQPYAIPAAKIKAITHVVYAFKGPATTGAKP